MSSAELGIWARVEKIRQADVQKALWEKRSLVKTWCMRGTLHLLSAADFPTYMAALGRRLDPRSPDWLRHFGPSMATTQRTVEAIRKALYGRNLTRVQLAREVEKISRLDNAKGRELLSGWGAVLQPAAFAGALCFGPSRGQNVTFVRPDQWIKRWDEVDPEDALRTLVRRFVSTYGPCTYNDFAHWWGWLRGSARRAMLALISDELEEVRFEGRRAWVLRDDTDRLKRIRAVRSVRLLPSWDCYVMFYSPRELFISDANRARLFRQIQGNAPALVVDGVAAGVWERRLRGDRLEVEVRPFAPIGREGRQGVEKEVEGLGEFLNVCPTIRYVISRG
jgi:hypothetical protein